MSGISDYTSYQIIAGTEQQYTGLQDKDGKEIYEGDILEFNCYHDTCLYDKSDSVFAVMKYQTMSGDFCNGIGFNIVDKNDNPVYVEMSKIIGNTIETPELV